MKKIERIPLWEYDLTSDFVATSCKNCQVKISDLDELEQQRDELIKTFEHYMQGQDSNQRYVFRIPIEEWEEIKAGKNE